MPADGVQGPGWRWGLRGQGGGRGRPGSARPDPGLGLSALGRQVPEQPAAGGNTLQPEKVMMSARKVVVLCGGDGAEREVSLRRFQTGRSRGVAKFFPSYHERTDSPSRTMDKKI